VKNHSGIFLVKKMAQTLKILRNRYYSWLNAPTSDHERRDKELGEIIEHIHKENRGVYGSPQVHREIKEKGIRCSRKRIARTMLTNGLTGAQDHGHGLLKELFDKIFHMFQVVMEHILTLDYTGNDFTLLISW